jgi:hypothetical protein
MIAIPTRPAHGDDAADALDDLDIGLEIGMSLEPFVDGLPVRRDQRGERSDHTDAITDAAEHCIVRFAALEADVSTADLAGVGRVSAVRYPRLGGVLHGRIVPGSRAATFLAVGAERTIRAGYRAALATQPVAAVPVQHGDADELWDEFLPASYRIPRRVAAVAWDVCRFDEFWVSLLVELGLDGDAKRFGNGHVSPLSRSIRGLSTVGVALALTERGGRHDRLTSGRRGVRGARREGGALPPAPQIVLD